MFASLPDDRQERWALLSEAIALWYSPLSDADGVPMSDLQLAEARLGVLLPSALQEWFQRAGRRADVWSRNDQLLMPAELQRRDDVLVFYVENQSVVEWGIRYADLRLEDPPVMMSSPDRPARWSVLNSRLSEFAVQMFVTCLKWSNRNRCWGSGPGNSTVSGRIEANYTRTAFPDWPWPAHPTRLYEGADIIIETAGRSDTCWINIVSRSETAFRQFTAAMAGTGLEWEATSDDWPPGWVSLADEL